MQRLSILISRYLFILALFSSAAYAQTGYAINFQNLDYLTHGDFIYCGSPNYGFADKLTVAAWVKWTTDAGNFAVTPSNHENEGAYSTYIAYGSHNSNDITADNGQFWLRNAKTGNKFEFLVENTSGTIAKATASVGPALTDRWYYITGVYNGSTVKIYVDGVEKGSANLTGSIKTNDGTHRLNMGKLPWGYGFFVGCMDEVRIWKAALTPEEIASQMYSISTVNEAGLASFWNLNAGSGTSIDDSGPINADGIFYSAAIDVHGSSDFPHKIINDGDKTWVVNYWAGATLKTVAGAGVDETNAIVSNTEKTLTLTYGFAGTAPDNRTTPGLDGSSLTNDTWFGIEKSGETTQWVVSDLVLPAEITSFTAAAASSCIELKWQTATEVNNYGFEIERAPTEGTGTPAYQRIGFVPGAGNSNVPRSYSFQDKEVKTGRYLYRLKQTDNDGSFKYSYTAAEVISPVPDNYELSQNYPNPFNPSTVISYQLPRAEYVSLKIYDMTGREVAVLVNNRQEAGTYSVNFNTGQMTSGIYFARLDTENFTRTIKMTFIK